MSEAARGRRCSEHGEGLSPRIKSGAGTEPRRSRGLDKVGLGEGWTWALPEELQVPPDELRARLDLYRESIVLHLVDGESTVTRPVSALDVAAAFTRHLRLHSGLLPEGALWWSTGPEGPEVALWRPPQVWRVAVQLEAFKPPRRMRLPMPGLVFLCQPSRPPWVWAAKRRPRHHGDHLYRAPLLNVFDNGLTCAGTHRYPEDVAAIPESFFLAFFTREGDGRGRSKRHPEELLALWAELDGRRRFPLRDLAPWGTVEDVLRRRGR